jgi:FAD/FMN-containing dehydrogenase
MLNSAETEARIVKKESRIWSNKHENYSVPIAGLYDIWNPDVSGGQMIKGYRATTRSIQGLISNAVLEGVRLRAIGSGWSISRAVVTDGWLVNTKPLNWVFRISDSSISVHYSGDSSNLLFAQCGVSIGELNRYLSKRGNP